jgi:hypothetical protein
MVTDVLLDVPHCERLVARIVQGDAVAQRKLVEHLWPCWLKQVRGSRGMAALAQSEDHVREVATRVAQKIGKPGAPTLRLYPFWREKHADRDFGDWIRIVVANAIRDYVREQIGNVRIPDGDLSPKRLLNELTMSGTGEVTKVRPPFTAAQAARQIVEFAQDHLPQDQLRALSLWLQGATDVDLDRDLETAPGGGRALMRAGVATLRRKFSNST